MVMRSKRLKDNALSLIKGFYRNLFSKIQMGYPDQLFLKCACVKLSWRLTVEGLLSSARQNTNSLSGSKGGLMDGVEQM